MCSCCLYTKKKLLFLCFKRRSEIVYVNQCDGLIESIETVHHNHHHHLHFMYWTMKISTTAIAVSLRLLFFFLTCFSNRLQYKSILFFFWEKFQWILNTFIVHNHSITQFLLLFYCFLFPSYSCYNNLSLSN